MVSSPALPSEADHPLCVRGGTYSPKENSGSNPGLNSHCNPLGTCKKQQQKKNPSSGRVRAYTRPLKSESLRVGSRNLRVLRSPWASNGAAWIPSTTEAVQGTALEGHIHQGTLFLHLMWEGGKIKLTRCLQSTCHIASSPKVSLFLLSLDTSGYRIFSG